MIFACFLLNLFLDTLGFFLGIEGRLFSILYSDWWLLVILVYYWWLLVILVYYQLLVSVC